MSLKKRLAALAMAGVMALSLTACSPKEMLSNAILSTATLLASAVPMTATRTKPPKRWPNPAAASPSPKEWKPAAAL